MIPALGSERLVGGHIENNHARPASCVRSAPRESLDRFNRSDVESGGTVALPFESTRRRQADYELRGRKYVGQAYDARSLDGHRDPGALGQGFGWRSQQHEAGRFLHVVSRQAAGPQIPLSRVFVVFRKPATILELRVPALVRAPLTTLRGPWSVSFQRGRGARPYAQFKQLGSWTDNEDAGIKYFSGTATYRRTLAVSATWLGKDRRVELDLGAVSKLARVLVNGRDLGILWKPPYRADVTRALHAGANQLQIRVTNLWVNRLIGDQQPDAKQVTFTTFNPYKADSPLLESGLLGPVVVSQVFGGDRP